MWITNVHNSISRGFRKGCPSINRNSIKDLQTRCTFRLNYTCPSNSYY